MILAMLVWRREPAIDSTDAPGAASPLPVAQPEASQEEHVVVPAASCDEGAPCNPVEVGALPFADARDTRRSTVSIVDRYSCSDANESGSEIWYRLTIDEPGTLLAAIVEDPYDGVDVDVHLLSAPSGDACLARGNRRVNRKVAPGTYWLVLDTYAGETGATYAGPYELTVAFTPEG